MTVFEQMMASDDVKMRDLGVIAGVLLEHDVDQPLLVAQAIIKAQTAAGLATFILDDVRTHMREIAARARRDASTTDVEPYHGKAVDTGTDMVTSRVRLTRDEFAAVARGDYVPGQRPLHGPPTTDA